MGEMDDGNPLVMVGRRIAVFGSLGFNLRIRRTSQGGIGGRFLSIPFVRRTIPLLFKLISARRTPYPRKRMSIGICVVSAFRTQPTIFISPHDLLLWK